MAYSVVGVSVGEGLLVSIGTVVMVEVRDIGSRKGVESGVDLLFVVLFVLNSFSRLKLKSNTQLRGRVIPTPR